MALVDADGVFLSVCAIHPSAAARASRRQIRSESWLIRAVDPQIDREGRFRTITDGRHPLVIPTHEARGGPRAGQLIVVGQLAADRAQLPHHGQRRGAGLDGGQLVEDVAQRVPSFNVGAFLNLVALDEQRLATTFTPAGATVRRAYNAVWRGDPVLRGLQVTPQRDPDSAPAESFTQSTIDRIRMLS